MDFLMKTSLELSNISKKFGGLTALEDITFSLHEGETLGLLGPNGAGKTTLFNLICGMKPSFGNIFLNKEEITGLKPNEICQRGIARTFQLIRVFTDLSVLDNVSCAILFGRNKQSIKDLSDARSHAMDFLHLLKLAENAVQPAKNLSFSERRRLEIARALATGPDILLLDEVMAGLTSNEASDMLEMMDRIRAEKNVTIMMIEHTMRMITAMCDRIVVINFGIKIAEGPPEEVLKEPEVIKAYLGEEDA
jgi:branched-chain amino acid transport system ATP-binding protein